MKKIETSNQIKIAYQDAGTGIPIILIHGLAAFYSLKKELRKHYRVIVYDVRGHGKSTHSMSYNLNDHIKDLTMLMQQLDIKSAHLLGHDMGGMIAQAFTEKYKDKVRSLTIISSKSEDIVHGFTKLMIEHQDKVAGFNKSEALLILFPYIYKKSDVAMKWFQRQRLYSKQDDEDSAVASRALLDTENQSNTVTHEINVPTMIVDGRYDPIIINKENQQFENQFKNINYVLFNESGHAPHIEEEEKFLTLYLNFVEKNDVSNTTNLLI
ncbi:alpha/beta hydrolase [Staphylococcus hominis subsp. novobiosepticus]|uniref:alpha/beta fold hydrolase n=1 Tax=Staphylococcus hominis TaxID=1290 RepID=UPI003255AC56